MNGLGSLLPIYFFKHSDVYLSVVKINQWWDIKLCRASLFYDLTLHFIESSKPNPNQISTSNGKPGAVNGAVGTTFQPQNPLLGRACESCYGKFSPAGLYFLFGGLFSVKCREPLARWLGGVEQLSRGTWGQYFAGASMEPRSEQIDAHPYLPPAH